MLQQFQNHNSGNEIYDKIICDCIYTVLVPITVNAVLQEFFCHAQMLRSFITAPAPGFVGADYTVQTNLFIIRPETRMQFLFTVFRPVLIEDIACRSMVMSRLFCQNAGFLNGCQIDLNGDSIPFNAPCICPERFFFCDKPYISDSFKSSS